MTDSGRDPDTLTNNVKSLSGDSMMTRNGHTPDDGITQIREILFGEQMVAYESRFARLEEHISASNKALRELLQTAINDALRDEREARGQAFTALREELDGRFAELSRAQGESSEAFASTLESVREQLETRIRQADGEVSAQRQKLQGLFRELTDKLGDI